MGTKNGVVLEKAVRPRFFYGYVIALAAFSILAVTYGSQLTFGVFFKPLAEEFGWTRAATSAAYSLNLTVHGILGIIMGRLTDRFGPRMTVMLFGSFLGIGYLLLSQTNALWQFYLLFGAVLAIGLSTGMVPPMATVTRWFVKRRGLVNGIASSGVNFGQVIMSLLAGWLILSYGWRKSYFIAGLGLLVAILFFGFLLKRDPADIGEKPYGAESASGDPAPLASTQPVDFSLSRAARMPSFWLLWVTYFCFGFSRSLLTVHTAPLITDMGFPLTFAAGILAFMGGLAIVGRLALGTLADRLGGRATMRLGFVLMAVSTLWLTVAREVWALYLFAAVFGFSWGGLACVRVPLAAEVFGVGSLGAILGVTEFGTALGGAAGPLVGGWLFDIYSSYQTSLLVSAGISILAVLLMSLLMKRRGGG
ncbi:MAG: MFS transporter [Chloroflexota bacterium]